MGLVERLAGCDLPLPRLEELGRRAHDLRRPVAVAEHDLPAAAQRGRGGLHALHLALHRIGVVLGDRQLRTRALARAAHREVAGQHDDEVGAQALDLVLDARLRAGADGDHRDHRAHADDDAEHRQRGAQLVDAQGGQRDAQRGEEVHACRKVGSDTTFSATRSPGVAEARVASDPTLRRAASAALASAGALRVSETIFPSRNAMQPRRERRDVLLVRDDDDGDAGAVELLQQRHHLEARRRIEGARGLVGEDQLGIVDQRARDGDALLLASGKLRGTMIRARAKPDLLQLLHRAGTTLRRRDAAVEQRQLDVFQRRRARQQVELLEHESDRAVADAGQLVGGEPGDVLAVEPVGARRRHVEAADHVHERRLARARRAHDRDELAFARWWPTRRPAHARRSRRGDTPW